MTSLLAACGGKSFVIEAEKLLLRPLGKENLTERYHAWLNDLEVNRFSSRRGRRFSCDDVSAYVDAANSSPDRLLLGIFLREGSTHVGNVQLNYFDRENGVADISNLLGERSEWGRGLIVDADKQLINFGFQTLGVRKFVMGNIAPNRASTFKSRSLGAQLEGRLRRHEAFDGGYVDVLRFGLFPEEFYSRFPELGGQA